MVSPESVAVRREARPWPLHELANAATGLGAIERLTRNGAPVPPDLARDFSMLVQRTSNVAVLLATLQVMDEARHPEERLPQRLVPLLRAAGLPTTALSTPGPLLDAPPAVAQATLATLALLARDPSTATVTLEDNHAVLSTTVTREPPHPAAALLANLVTELLDGRFAWAPGTVQIRLPLAATEEVSP